MRAFSDSEKEIICARLLEAAYRLFSKQGFSRTNVAQLARAAGIGKGTFYIFFNSKEELLWALHQKMHGDFGTRLQPFLGDLARNPEHTIRRFLESVFDLFADPLVIQLQQSGDWDRIERMLTPEQIKEHRDAAIEPLLLPIREAQKAGALILGDPEVIAGAMRAICFLPLYKEEIGPGTYQRVEELLITLVARGLTRRTADEQAGERTDQPADQRTDVPEGEKHHD